jgi:hypothetical protein
MLKPFEHRPGYSRGELSDLKHQQLARQVGAFRDFAIESSVDLNNMIFSAGITFIFGSWICEADENGKLRSHLMEISTPQVSPDISTATLDQLAKKLSHLLISNSTWTREVIINHDSYSDMSGLEILSKVQDKDLVHFPLGLKNSTSIYQDMISYIMQSEQDIPLTGA